MSKETNILDLYFKEVSRYPLLSVQDEQDIGKNIQDLLAKIRAAENPQDKAELYNKLFHYKNIMIQSNLRLVVKIAREFMYFGIPLLDLINEGNIGLMTAVEKFDYTRGCRFSTYSAYWIKQAIRKCLAEKEQDVSLPDIVLDLIQDPYDCISDYLIKKTVSDLVNRLSCSEKRIIQLRFGLTGNKPFSLEETGKRLSLSRERVRQIQEKAIGNLREMYDYAIAG